ncbi:hypothetical protein, partial [Mesorhizobium sp. M7A.F.Ca.CA.004.01.1.1]|uniref:hypothetical protein n=1 Tax=Mesorhizobium sp. M7A.F.Ca.CA.004.01.1.1 TaxID=2496689 RepID=UPI0013E2FBA7
GIEGVGADDREGDDERERDDCDLEEQHDAEAYCAEDYGDIAWSNDTDMPQEGSDWHRNGW